MFSSYLKIGTAALLVAGLTAYGASGAEAQQKILKSETGNPGGTSHVVTAVAAKIWARELGLSVQINDSQTLTRSALKLGRGQLDIMPLPPVIFEFMQKGSRMYRKKLKKQAIAAAKQVTSLFGFVANLFHPITFEGSGIKVWKDIKGKRVFTGPPSGAAAVTSELMITLITGYKPNQDYRAVRLPWGGGLQAMLDGKLDVFIRPAGVGSALVEQLGIKKKFRLLNAGDATKTAVWKKRYLGKPGRVTGLIPAGTYRGQLGGDVVTGGGTFMMVVRRGLDENMVYRMTKAIWENLDEIHKTAVTLRGIDRKNPFLSVNPPLHKGAIRYYREAGYKIPKGLM
jgi:hypothetical protein